MLMEVWEKTQKALAYGDKSNANVDSLIISSKQSLVRGYVSKELYKHNFLTVAEQEAIQDGFIYIHDLDQLLYPQINCCLFDIGEVMREGFEMANTKYTEPQSLRTALQLVSDIVLCASSQQFGGFTVPELDKLLVPYYEKSLSKHLDDAARWYIEEAFTYAVEKTEDELKQGLQAFSLKTNTIPSSRGDFAFTTVTFGLLDDEEIYETQKRIAEAILKDRMSYSTPPVFPKLVYLYNEETNHEDLFDLAIECSCRCLYPDFLSLSGDGYVADMYRKYGKAVSPMGCRAFLSEGCGSFVGRANIGAVSLNLPMIYKLEGDFYYNLAYYLTMIRGLLIKRYEYLAKAPCSTNPLAFTQGGLMGGTKRPDEPIGDLVKNFTASFGITALNELNVLHEGKPLHESNQAFVI
jgi:ribonucleoside-triphosphate reductase (formate)